MFGMHHRQDWRHKRLSAVGPTRTRRVPCDTGRDWGESQTPFGCWSDQDRLQEAVEKLGVEQAVTNAFRLLVRPGPGERPDVPRPAGRASQTPFGCWSDQDP